MVLVSEKRPILLGLAAAVSSLGLVLFVPPGILWRDVSWTALVLVVAVSLIWFERRLSRRGQPLAPLRWVALALALVATVQLVWVLRRAA
jgi:hypothetical protein